MLRMKVLLLLAVTTTTVLLAGCSGVGGAETSTSNGAGTTPSVDTTAPSMPTGLTGAAAGSTGANLSWSASTDNVGVTAYILLRNGVQVATPVSTSFADTGLSAATTYSYTVAARDAAGNISPNSTSVSVTTASAAATTAPSTPTGLTGAAAGSGGAGGSQFGRGPFRRKGWGCPLIPCAAGAPGPRRPPQRVLPTRVCPLQRPTAIRWRPAMRPATSHPIRRA